MFVPHTSLESLIAKNRRGPLVASLGGPRFASALRVENVRYVKCPVCHQHMNRTSFAKGSGIVVDLCRLHGTWFDSDELSRALLFVAKGGERTTPAAAKTEPRSTPRRAVIEAEVALMHESFRDNERAAHGAWLVARLAALLFDVLSSS